MRFFFVQRRDWCNRFLFYFLFSAHGIHNFGTSGQLKKNNWVLYLVKGLLQEVIGLFVSYSVPTYPTCQGEISFICFHHPVIGLLQEIFLFCISVCATPHLAVHCMQIMKRDSVGILHTQNISQNSKVFKKEKKSKILYSHKSEANILFRFSLSFVLNSGSVLSLTVFVSGRLFWKFFVLFFELRCAFEKKYRNHLMPFSHGTQTQA